MKWAALACAVSFSVVCFGASPTVGEAFHTHRAASDIHLDSGVAVHLTARSSGTIFADHAVLEKGTLELSNFPGYQVQAGSLQIESQSPDARATIHVHREIVDIASTGGDLKVLNGGVMLARVPAGAHMFFQNTGSTRPPGTASGASPGRRTLGPGIKIWAIVVIGIAAAALAIGLTAVAEGKAL